MPLHILKNASALMLVQIINPIISLALVVSLARVLGAEGLGQYTFAISMVAIFEVVGGLGIREYLIREINKSPGRWPALLTSALALGAVAALFAQIAMLAIAKIIGYEAESLQGLLIVSFALGPAVLYSIFESMLYAFEHMAVAGAIAVAETAMRVGLSLLVLGLGGGVAGLLAAYLAGRVLAMLLAWGAHVKYVGRAAVVWEAAVFRALFKVAPTFAAMALLAIVYWRLDVLMLSRLADAEAVGQYSAAYRLMYLLALAGANVMAAVYPAMTRVFQQGREHFALIIDKGVKYTLMIYVPVAVAVTALSAKLVALLFGEKFDAAVPALQILIWVALPLTLARLFANGLVAAHQQHLDLRVNFYRLLWYLVLNYALISWLGVNGACLAALISAVAAIFLQRHYLGETARRANLLKHSFKPCGAAAVMALGLQLAGPWPLVVQIPLAATIYLAVLFVLKPFDLDDRRLLRFLDVRPAGETV